MSNLRLLPEQSFCIFSFDQSDRRDMVILIIEGWAHEQLPSSSGREIPLSDGERSSHLRYHELVDSVSIEERVVPIKTKWVPPHACVHTRTRRSARSFTHAHGVPRAHTPSDTSEIPQPSTLNPQPSTLILRRKIGSRWISNACTWAQLESFPAIPEHVRDEMVDGMLEEVGFHSPKSSSAEACCCSGCAAL